MKFFKWDLFKKSNNTQPITSELFNYLIKEGYHERVNETQAYNLYETIAPLADSIDMITTKFADLKPVLVDKDGQLVENAVIDNFFRQPNDFDMWNDFATNCATNYLIHNNLYLQVLGNIKSRPLGVYVVPNDKVTLTPQNNAVLYQVITNGLFHFLSGTFNQSSLMPRIVTPSNDREIYHIRGFNSQNDTLLSYSKLRSIKRDIDVIDSSLETLRSILKKGFNAAALAQVDTDDDNVIIQISKELNTLFSGSSNAGKVVVSKGKDIQLKNIEQTNREMQTIENKLQSTKSVYSRYEIPAPLVDQAVQTFNNYQTAVYSLYDNAVFPLARKIFQWQTKIFRDRKVINDNERISFDSSSIPAMQLRFIEEMKNLKEVGTHSINELRRIYGSESIGPEGDQIYIEASKIPIGEDDQTNDNLRESRKSMVFDLKKSGFNESEILEYMREYEEIKSKE